MTQLEETESHEIKPASHCLNLKPNLSFMAQTETTERKRGGESDTSVADGGEGEGGGKREIRKERGRRRTRKHISDRTQQQRQQVHTVSLLLFEHHSF